MRGDASSQQQIFRVVTTDAVVPEGHPLRAILAMVNRALEGMSGCWDGVYAKRGRPSIPPEKMLKALLLQVLYSIPSERRLMEWIGHDLMFQWFVGLGAGEQVWDASSFSKNRERLLAADAAQRLLVETVAAAEARGLLANDEFRVDGTLIQSWASRRSFGPRPDPPAEGSGRGGRMLVNDACASRTDPEARMYGQGAPKQLYHMAHVLSDGRHGLVVAARITAPSPAAERRAALEMLAARRGRGGGGATLAADKGYDEPPFVRALAALGITAHIARYRGRRRSSIPDAVAQTEAYRRSQRNRKRIEQIFSWIKAEGRLRRARHRGRARVGWVFTLATAAYNLVRISHLGPATA